MPSPLPAGTTLAPLLLLAIPLVAGLIPLGRRRGAAAPDRADIPIALGAALAVCLLLAFHLLAVASQDRFPMWVSDFDAYCDVTAQVVENGMTPFPHSRSILAAWLPAWGFSTLGVYDSFAVYAMLSMVLLGMGAYLWGLAVHGRVAALASLLLVTMLDPLAALARNATFYPVNVACSVLLAGSVAALIRFRGWAPALLAGSAAGAALVFDARGIVIAGPLVGLGLLAAALRGRAVKGAALRVGLLLLPLVVSWWLAHVYISQGSPGIVGQSYAYAASIVVDAGLFHAWPHDVQALMSHDFLWGHSPLRMLPGTLAALGEISSAIPESIVSYPESVFRRARWVWPWVTPTLACLALAAALLWRSPTRLLALVLPALPFAALLYQSSTILPQARQMASYLVFVPVFMGVGFALLVDHPWPLKPPPRDDEQLAWWRRARWRSWLALAALAVAAAGLIPGPLAPGVDFRQPELMFSPNTADALGRALESRFDTREPCDRALWRDRQRGISRISRIYRLPASR